MNDRLGNIAPGLVYGSLIISISEAVALASVVALSLCASDTECRQSVASMVNTVASAIALNLGNLRCIRCRFDNHLPHHSFMRPRFGIPPWKKCWMRHYQVNCWRQGVKNSNFLELRIPYGPCYKNRNGNPPVTH